MNVVTASGGLGGYHHGPASAGPVIMDVHSVAVAGSL
jgi:hypothetical protein